MACNPILTQLDDSCKKIGSRDPPPAKKKYLKKNLKIFFFKSKNLFGTKIDRKLLFLPTPVDDLFSQKKFYPKFLLAKIFPTLIFCSANKFFGPKFCVQVLSSFPSEEMLCATNTSHFSLGHVQNQEKNEPSRLRALYLHD